LRSLATRLVAFDVKAIRLPFPEIDGVTESPLPPVPSVAAEIRAVVAPWRSRRKMS
jgi:hypothetical protein